MTQNLGCFNWIRNKSNSTIENNRQKDSTMSQTSTLTKHSNYHFFPFDPTANRFTHWIHYENYSWRYSISEKGKHRPRMINWVIYCSNNYSKSNNLLTKTAFRNETGKKRLCSIHAAHTKATLFQTYMTRLKPPNKMISNSSCYLII